MTVNRPIVRYHGGKWRLAPWIIAQMPAHRVYVEPFGGAASVLLRKPRSYAEIYNDLDGEIVNLFAVLREPELSALLAEAVRLTPFARDEFELSYRPSESPVEQARRTMVRCGMGFGSSALSNSHKTGFRGSATQSGSGHLIVAYECCDCGLFHIGHADYSQRLARGPLLSGACSFCQGKAPEERRVAAMTSDSPILYCSEACKRKAAKARKTARNTRQAEAIGVAG